MKLKVVPTIVILSIILISLIPSAKADMKMIIPDENEPSMEPIAFGNYQMNPQKPEDMCVTNTGITFTVTQSAGFDLSQELYRRTAFSAWNSNGSLRWLNTSTSDERILFGVSTDNSYVYATGGCNWIPFLAKYDFDGNRIWNSTWDFGERSVGHIVDTTDDGTIIVGGSMTNVSLGNFVIAFDSQGNSVWSHAYENSPSLACWENHIFISCDGLLEKHQSNGDLVWASPIQSNSSVCVKGSSVYTIPIPTYASNWVTSFSVTRWDASTGEELWTHTIGIHNATHHEYACQWYTYSVGRNESIALLMKAVELESWYLITVSKSGTIISRKSLLDNGWFIALFEFEEDGSIRVIGTGTFGLGVALFDRILSFGELPEGIDIPLVVAAFTGVIIFDVGLIFYMKKQYAKGSD